MKKKFVSILFSIILMFSINFKKVSAATVTRQQLPYEILDISFDKNNMTIKGWAYLNNTQHYRSQSDHATSIILKGNRKRLVYKANVLPISFTDLESYLGSDFCPNNQYNKPSHHCNYRYDNVGFEVKVPLKDLDMDEQYHVSLKFDALHAKKSGEIDIYYPIKKAIQHNDGQYQYFINSTINDVSITVSHTTIFVRNGPNKQSKIYQTNKPCVNYNTNLYYLNGSKFNRILDRHRSGNSTYYKLSGKLGPCHNDRRTVIEGNAIAPIWIASNFVSYQGKGLTIRTKEINNYPVIHAENMKVYQGEKINIMKNVTATDKEDGNLTKFIKIIKNTYVDKVGSYVIVYQVTDSGGLTTTKERRIEVLRNNTNPVINAKDKHIKQYSKFDPLKDATATDQFKKDITNKLIATNEIDTSKLETQQQCYYVKDDYNYESRKCINVYIEKMKTIKKLRFINKEKPYKEYPLNWLKHKDKFHIGITNTIPYASNQ